VTLDKRLTWSPHIDYVELALYVDDTVIIATYRNPTLLVSYIYTYLSNLQLWLTKWRIAINVSKRLPIIFAIARRLLIQPRPGTLFGQPIK
jgi:hypothetical protein